MVTLPKFEIGDEVLLSTEDRKHPFKGTVESISEFMISFQTAKTLVVAVLRPDGAVGHMVRYGIRRSAWPITTKLVDVQLCN